MSKAISDNTGEVDFASMYATAVEGVKPNKDKEPAQPKKKDDSNEFVNMYNESQKKKLSSNGGGKTSNQNFKSQSQSQSQSQQEINDAFSLHTGDNQPTIDNLDSVEKKNLNADTPIPSNPASNQQGINKIVQQRQDPVYKLKNATDFYEQDMQDNPDTIKGINPKEILTGGEKHNAATYYEKRVTQLKNVRDHIASQIVSPETSGNSMMGEYTTVLSKQDEENNALYKKQLGDIDNKLQEFNKYANILNTHQAVTEVPLPADKTPENLKNYYRNIGIKTNVIDDPIATGRKEDNVKLGFDGQRNQEIVQLEDFRATSQGLDAAEENLKARFGLGSISEYEYKTGAKEISDTRSKMFDLYPRAKEVAKYQSLGQVLQENRTKKYDSQDDEKTAFQSAFENLIYSGYSDEEIKAAAKTLNLSDDEVKKAINNKEDIPGTSMLGTFYNSSVAHGSQDITSLFKTSAANEADRYETDKSYQLANEQKYEDAEVIRDTHPTIKDANGKSIPNPNFLMQENNPDYGNHNWGYGALNTVANATGSLAALWVTTEATGALGDAALGGVIGGDVVGAKNTIKGIQDVTKFTKEQKALFGNVAGMTLSQYSQNKEAAKEFIGKEQGGEKAQDAYALTMGISTGLLFGLGSAPQELIGKALGTEEKLAAKEFADMIPSKGIEALDKNKWADFVKNNLLVKIGYDGLKENAKATAMMAVNQAVQVGVQAMFNPQSVQSKNVGNDIINEGIKNFLTFAPISFFGAGIGVLSNPHDNQTKLEQEAIYRMGKDPVTYKNFVDGQVKDSKLSQQDANNKIHLVNEMAAIHNSGLVNENLSRSEKVEYANNALHEKILQQKVDAMKKASAKDSQIQIKERQIEKLVDRRTEILNNSDGVDKDADGKPLTPTYKIGDKPVTKEIFLHALKQGDAKELLSNAEVSGDEKTQEKLRNIGAIGTSESDYKTSTGVKQEGAEQPQKPELSFVGKQDDVLVKDRTFFNENEEKEYHDLISDGKQDDADLMIEQRKKELIEAHKKDISSPKTEQNEKAKEASKGQNVVSNVEPAEPVSEVGSTTKEDNVTVGDMVDKKGSYKGQRGSFIKEGQSIEFHTDKGNKIYELGNADKLKDTSIKDFGIEQEESVTNLKDDGTVESRGKKYTNPEPENPLKTIQKNKDGEITGVKMLNENGKVVTFRGQRAEDLAYQLHLKEITKDNETRNKFEQFINEDEPAKQEINNAGLSESTEKEPAKSNAEVSREKLEPKVESKATEPVLSKEEEIQEPKKEEGNEPPVEPPKPLNLEGKEPQQQWTAIRKSKLQEVENVKKLFDSPERKKWSGVIESAMANLQGKYPDKNLYDAAKSRINEFATLYDNKVPFNPTTEDLAVMQYFKADTEKRINEIQGWDSSDDLLRISAMAQFEALNNDLVIVAKAINPSEAGRAFGFRQSETRLDPEFGLQVRRMELMDAKGGEKLSEEDLKFTAEQWEKEKDLMQRENDLKTKSMQESFDKELDNLKKDYDKKLKDASSKKDKPKEENRKQLLSQSGKEFADKLRSGKLKGGTYATIPGFPQAVNLVIESIAQIVEKGSTLAEAISEYAKSNKVNDEDKFKDNFLRVLENRQTKESSFDKIKEHAELNKVNGITAEMVGKNLIKDYVNSHIGEIDNKDILNTATENLKEVFPDITKEKLTEAYLKRGEFEQPTKKKLDNDFKESQNKLVKLAKIEKYLNDFKSKKNLFKENTPLSTIKETDSNIAAKEKELKLALNDAGVKTSNEDKYAKASYESRAQSHNDRIDNLTKKLQEKIENSKLTDEEKASLTKLNGQLQASKIKLDTDSKFSHAPVVDNGLAVLKKVKSEFDRNIKVGNINVLGEFKRDLQQAIDKFGVDKDLSEQNIKLERTKDKYQRDIDEFKRKINAGEFEDKPIVSLTKSDAELIKLEKEKLNISQQYYKKKDEYERANKSGVKRTFEFARAAYVDWLIGSPVTFARVAVSAVVRPNVEALTKVIGGTIFQKLLPEMGQQAKKGGESNKVGAGYEAYAMQYSPEQIEKKYTEANDKYEKSSKAYNEFKGQVESMDKRTADYRDAEKKLQKLDNAQKKDLVNVVSKSVYQFIAGSSIMEGLQVLQHRTATIESMFGEFDTEGLQSLKDSPNKFASVLDNINYTMNYIGRSHAALKTFSGRFSFAAGFVARLEGAVNDGIDITKPDKILEIANESYLDWDRGKYQQSNMISDGWNKVVKAVDDISPTAAYIMKSDVAVTRVPVNILHEAVMEYTLGAVTSAFNVGKEYYKAAKKIDLKVTFDKAEQEEFKNQLKEEISKIDPEKAAAIARAFRKGGFGLGMYALGALAGIQFGGFGHKGQTADDKKTKKIESETGVKQLMTGQIKIGDKVLGDNVGKIIEHSSQLYPLFLGLGLKTVYENNIKQGKSSSIAASKDALQHINTILGSIPQISKVLLPMATDVYQSVVPKVGSWDDVDKNGNPIKRKPFEMRDYLNIIPGYGNKKDVLSDFYFKQAVRIKKSFEVQKSEIENNANLSEADRKQQSENLDAQENTDIDNIYLQNKNNPQ